jgi:hypothetical protein
VVLVGWGRRAPNVHPKQPLLWWVQRPSLAGTGLQFGGQSPQVRQPEASEAAEEERRLPK